MRYQVWLSGTLIFDGALGWRELARHLQHPQTYFECIDKIKAVAPDSVAAYQETWGTSISQIVSALMSPRLFDRKTSVSSNELTVLDYALDFKRHYKVVVPEFDQSGIEVDDDGIRWLGVPALLDAKATDEYNAHYAIQEPTLITCHGVLQILEKSDTAEVKRTIRGTAWELYCYLVEHHSQSIALELMEECPYWISHLGNRVVERLNGPEATEYTVFAITQNRVAVNTSVDYSHFMVNKYCCSDVEKEPEALPSGRFHDWIRTMAGYSNQSSTGRILKELSRPSTYDQLMIAGSIDIHELEIFDFRPSGSQEANPEE